MRQSPWLLVAAVYLCQACVTIEVKVPVMKPAQINVMKYKQLAIEPVKNDRNNSMTDMLKTGIAESNRFTILDRENLNRVMREQKLSASEVADSSSGPQLGRTLVASAILVGTVEQQDYHDEVKSFSWQAVTADGKTVTHTMNTRNGQAIVKATLQITDVESGQIVKVKRFDGVEKASTSATDATPPGIDGNALLEKAKQNIVHDFVEAITPHQIMVDTTFFRDDKVPQLDSGVTLVKVGQYDDAIKTFSNAIDLCEKSALPSVIIGHAYWNRALAHEYSGKYDLARADVKKAFTYTNNADFMGELANIEQLEKDAKLLEAQMGPADTATATVGQPGT
jgi:curli biogenesis system outer membrane secretion channel CsgG